MDGIIAHEMVTSAIQDLTGVNYQTSTQHKETSPVRKERDNKDVLTILAVLEERKPFAEDNSLRNIET